MWFLVSILLGLVSGFLIILIFGLMKAGRRADEFEEKILDSMSPNLHQPKKNRKNKANLVFKSSNLAKPKFRPFIDN